MSMHVLVLLLGIVMIASTISISSSEAILPEAESLPVIENFDGSSDKFVPGQIVVGLKNTDPYFSPKVTIHGGQVINTIESLNAFVIKVPVHAEEKFISSILKNPNIKYAERDAVVNALYTPNDTYFNIQWGMQRIGMQSVWDVNPNLGAGITVAVVDTGIYYDHPDFAGTTIRTDIDYDFVDDDTDTRPTAVCVSPGGKTAESHSTFVSGIIAATKDNSKGVSGLAPVDILPIRVLGTCGSGSSSDVAAGISYAAVYADVINLSLGSSVPSTVIEEAVDAAYAAGVVIVAAAGNSGDDSILYPAGYLSVISVSATAQDDSLTSYSQFGETIELAAPGGTSGSCSTSGATYIVSTGVVPKGNSVDLTYTCGAGTSFSAPHVSGVAALIKASNPGITNADIRLHLQNTALDLGATGRDDSFGYGLVMADVAVSTPFGESPTQNNPPTADANGPYSGIEDSSITFDGTGSSDPDETDTLTYSWNFGDGSTGSGATPTHAYSWGDTFAVTLTVSDGNGGSNTATSTATIEEINDVPTADAGGPYSGTINAAITFDGSGSFDPDNQDGTTSNDLTLTYSWSFGDGGTGTGVNPSHTYSSTGPFTVSLTVSDLTTSDTSTTTVMVNNISAEVSVTSITPNSVARGQSVNVEIIGGGFVSGASVTLSNGSGPTPIVSSVVVVDGNTITATITTKDGGPPRDRVWDITVTNPDGSSDTLVGGFTVTVDSTQKGNSKAK